MGPDAYTASLIEKARFRPTRAALVSRDLKEYELRLFKGLNIPVFSSVAEIPYLDQYDVVGLLDAAEENSLPKRSLGQTVESTAILFVSKDDTRFIRNHLRHADSVVVCGDGSGSNVLDVVYHFFESLAIPSLLNIDLSDVRRIAKGVGLSFYESARSSDELIESLPRACSVAKSALIHFACTRDVTLSEVYRVSKAVSLRKELSEVEKEKILSDLPSVIRDSHTHDARPFRKVNIKIGLRVIDGESPPQYSRSSRIKMTGMLFGI